MREVRFGQDNAGVNLGVKLAGAKKRLMAEVAADARPFDGFERNAVGARQARGNEADIHCRHYSCPVAVFESRSVYATQAGRWCELRLCSSDEMERPQAI